jgi:hypothetical protein
VKHTVPYSTQDQHTRIQPGVRYCCQGWRSLRWALHHLHVTVIVVCGAVCMLPGRRSVKGLCSIVVSRLQMKHCTVKLAASYPYSRNNDVICVCAAESLSCTAITIPYQFNLVGPIAIAKMLVTDVQVS